VPDSDLSASQLRARYGVAGNKTDFSTAGKGDNSDQVMLAVGAFAVVLVIYFVGSFFLG
jgi:hypothetical protein